MIKSNFEALLYVMFSICLFLYHRYKQFPNTVFTSFLYKSKIRTFRIHATHEADL